MVRTQTPVSLSLLKKKKNGAGITVRFAMVTVTRVRAVLPWVWAGPLTSHLVTVLTPGYWGGSQRSAAGKSELGALRRRGDVKPGAGNKWLPRRRHLRSGPIRAQERADRPRHACRTSSSRASRPPTVEFHTCDGDTYGPAVSMAMPHDLPVTPCPVRG